MISYDYAKECFELIDGMLYWKHRPKYHFQNETIWKIWNKIHSGKLAGHIKTNGRSKDKRHSIKINHYNYYRSILIWLITYKKFPKLHLNHKDGNTLNDKIENLREGTVSQISYNKKIRSTNKSGYKGVCWDKHHKIWKAYITYNKQYLFLGSFPFKYQAVYARQLKAKELHGTFYREK